MAILKGEKFILRLFKKSDAKALAKNGNNKEVYNNTLRIPHPYTLKDAREWIEKNIREDKNKERKMINFVIDIDGELVGSIGFSGIEKEHKAELGYWLGEDYWGKGIITEAIKIVEKYGFRELGLKRIQAQVFAFNKGSARVLEKNNYKLEGILRKDVKKDGKYIDAYVYSKVK